MSLRARVRAHRGGFALDVALTVGAGEVCALLGPNGSGKTTLLQCLAGLLRLDEGRVQAAPAHGGPALTWAGPGRHLSPQARRVGLVLAEPLLFPHLDLRDNVAFGPRSRGVARRPARERAETELARVGLADLAGRRPAQVSTGQAQRAALARALATDPDVLLLDEPLSALDPQTRSATRSDLAQRLAGFGGVSVVVTHDPLDALTLAQRLVFLDGGRITQEGTPAQVVAAPRSAYAAHVVGLNLLHGVARSGAQVVVELDGEAAGERVVTAEEPDDVAEGAVLWCAVPPAAVSLFDEAPHGSARNTWPVVVTDVTLTGQRARVSLTGPVPLQAEVTVAAVAALGLRAGTRLWAQVKATEVTVYPA